MGSEFMQPSVLASSATASIRLAASGGSCSKKARRLARAALTDPEHLLPLGSTTTVAKRWPLCSANSSMARERMPACGNSAPQILRKLKKKRPTKRRAL